MMNRWIVSLLMMMTAWIGSATDSRGQDNRSAPDDVRAQIQRMNERMEALERQHEADQKRIQELEARVARMEQPSAEASRPVEIEEIRAQVRSELASAQRSGLFDLSSAAVGASNALNPQITVFFETGGSLSSDADNNALNRFNLREVELDLRAAITPTVDGVLIVTLEEEIESLRTGDVEIDRNVDIEEGYLNFHTLPHDLALKVGKFRNLFGRNNLLHTHDLPQVTRPLAVQNFLGPEGLLTTGASLSWLVPNPWDKYLNATVELVNDDGGEESPLLGGPNAENPAVLGHLKFFTDLSETSSLEIGGTYLFARTSSDTDFSADVFGLDLAYQWEDPDPSTFRSWLIQAEAFWSNNDLDRGRFFSKRNESFGAYVFAQYQFGQNWYVGLRGDYSEFPNSEARGDDDYDVALSPYLTWYLSEFLRVRMQYEHRRLDFKRGSGDEDAVFVQFTGVIGSHPPHPYWVRR